MDNTSLLDWGPRGHPSAGGAAKILRTQELLKGHGIDLGRLGAARPAGNPLATAAASAVAATSTGPRANPLANLPGLRFGVGLHPKGYRPETNLLFV